MGGTMSLLRAGLIAGLTLSLAVTSASAQIRQTKGEFDDYFRQLEEVLPTPNDYRTASGAPGHEYWQQRADYVIDVELDEEEKTLTGTARITYTNNSPDALSYLWLNLDQNRFAADSDYVTSLTTSADDRFPYANLRALQRHQTDDLGHKIESVEDARGRDLPFTLVQTAMRVDPPAPVMPGDSFTFTVEWSQNIRDAKTFFARGGYEVLEQDDAVLYLMAQWYPRMTAYSDYDGWHAKQFLGRGEFTLEFGDFEVNITVPDDHIVSATGTLQNPEDVLTEEQRDRLAEAARSYDEIVLIVTEEEAYENRASGTNRSKTWSFKAEDVRDFAWGSSRAFIWDAMAVKIDGREDDVLAMSFYPEEANPLWERYSTHALAQTIETYSRFSIVYPYPNVQSINGPIGGMEYPMVGFNGPRPVKDEKTGEKTYSRAIKYALITVVIHEAGHSFFPMIINSDERQWTWIDEGLNTFLQFVTEREWEPDYPSRRGEPRDIVDYMKSPIQVPIMTNSDSLPGASFGNNAYGKPATALNILRETIMGREVFDFAFKTFSERWAFKRPTPADFFRTMEDASGMDLDWFWRGWFYSTEHVDIALGDITHYRVDSKNPDIENVWKREQEEAEPESLTELRNADLEKRTERFPYLNDVYNENDRYVVTDVLRKRMEGPVQRLEDWEQELLESNDHLYKVQFHNEGGVVMPVILDITYEDGSTEELRMPAEVWRLNPKHFTKLLVADQPIVGLEIDPHWETADVDVYNNAWPAVPRESRLEMFKRQRPPSRNLMKELLDDQRAAEEAENEETEE